MHNKKNISAIISPKLTFSDCKKTKWAKGGTTSLPSESKQ